MKKYWENIEDEIAKRVGKRQPASGAMPHAKGDIVGLGDYKQFLLEVKTTEKRRFESVRKFAEKIQSEALAIGKFPGLVFDWFGFTWIMIPFSVFQFYVEKSDVSG